MTDTLVKKLYGRSAQGLPNQSDDERLMASVADAIEELREGVRAEIERLEYPCPCDCIDEAGFIDCQCGKPEDRGEVEVWYADRGTAKRLRALLGEDGQ